MENLFHLTLGPYFLVLCSRPRVERQAVAILHVSCTLNEWKNNKRKKKIGPSFVDVLFFWCGVKAAAKNFPLTFLSRFVSNSRELGTLQHVSKWDHNFNYWLVFDLTTTAANFLPPASFHGYFLPQWTYWKVRWWIRRRFCLLFIILYVSAILSKLLWLDKWLFRIAFCNKQKPMTYSFKK